MGGSEDTPPPPPPPPSPPPAMLPLYRVDEDEGNDERFRDAVDGVARVEERRPADAVRERGFVSSRSSASKTSASEVSVLAGMLPAAASSAWSAVRFEARSTRRRASSSRLSM